MPLFISDSELHSLGSDLPSVVQRADSFIHDLLQQLETHKARADAASITAEQSCAIIEQKFLALSSQFKQLEHEKAQLDSALEQRSAELAQAQAQLHKLELESMKKDSDKESLSSEVNEVRKARRDLLEVVDKKNAELAEKTSYIKTYLDKIVFLTDERSILEGKVRNFEAEMARSQAVQARLSQEKELLEQHNSWLNEELKDKVNTLLREQRKSADVEMDLRSKLLRSEQLGREAGESLQRSKEQLKDLESKLSQTREELRFTKEDAAIKEDSLSRQVATASKLAELHKETSEEWSKKAIAFEGVIKALEVHLNQVEADSKQQMEKEVQARKLLEKEAAELKERHEKIERQLESYKKGQDQDSLLMISAFTDAAPRDLDSSDQQLALEIHGEGPILPMVPPGISGTAFAATLLRDGWSLTKVYVKYQEAVDAWRHERWEKKQSQALLQRVLHEIEQRADVIMDERAEHTRMVEAYAIMEEKLHSSIEEQSSLENSIRDLQAELRKRERVLNSAQKECSDLQTQVTVLLKECTDIQLRFGVGGNAPLRGGISSELMEADPEITASDAVISEHLLTFKDIHGMVEQNSQLRSLVRSLGHQNEEREKELKDAFDLELKKRTDEAARKVSTILKKSEEQSELIASLQGSVGMYRRLYEEELRCHRMLKEDSGAIVLAGDANGDDMRSLIKRSREEMEKVRKEASERLSLLEDDLSKAKQEANATRSERDRLIVEATYAREQLQTIVKESENQRKEMDAVLARNVEFSQMITEYQRRLRENSEYTQSVEENSRRLSIEVSVLEREKELLSISERRVSQELSSLSDRVHRLQATLDNIHTVEEVRETMNSAEKKKLEEETNRMQKEWVEMKHELDAERAHVRHLTHERDQVVKQAMDRVEGITTQLADALRQVSLAETRAHVAEARCSDLEARLKKDDEKILAVMSAGKVDEHTKGILLEPGAEALSMLAEAREDIDRLKDELDASKSHTEQYKKLAQINEEALVQMEDAHNRFKEEAEKTRKSLQSEVSSLRESIVALEKQAVEREKGLVEAEAQRERELFDAKREITSLRDSESSNRMLIVQCEERIEALKADLEKEHQQWRTAQNNYERQVVLQADTIRELTTLSERYAILEKEVVELRTKAEMSTAELNSSKVAWEMEKATLLSEKEDLMKRVTELDDQNKLLLDRVEAMHILIAEQDRKGGEPLKGTGLATENLQDVIRYLRRSKETSDMEISLLKQERLRLQKQLESALHAAEDAQATLRREHENVRSTLCSDEQFKSLQSQVRELNLLRESNEQLRMENKQNFEACLELRERAQKDQAELDSLRRSLREREVELEAASKDSELEKAEVSRWQSRVSQLLQKYKSLDIEEYQRAQTDLVAAQEMLRLQQSEIEAAREESQKLEESIVRIGQEASMKDERICELEKKVQDNLLSEGTWKAETEKLRKQGMFLKRKNETLTKEKDDLAKEKEAYLKQIEDMKANSVKRGLGDGLRTEAQIRQEISSQNEQSQKENENLLKEKESRIQTLERTLERERDDLRKEKEVSRKERDRRSKDRILYIDLAKKHETEKQKLLEELNNLKREKDNYAENMQARKTVRTRIIRPKIEPLGQSELQAEAAETGNEMAIEVSEAEADMQDDLKVVSTVLENVCSTSAIIIASSHSAPLPDVTLPGIRKRLATFSHETIGETSIEQDPVVKKQRGIDVKQVAVDSARALVTVPENLVTTEAYKDVNMVTEHVGPSDLESLNRNDLEASVENVHAPIMPDNQKDARGDTHTEWMTVKRPRILRSDTSYQPQASAQKDEIANIQCEDDISMSVEGEHLSENIIPEAREELVVVGELMHRDIQAAHSPPHFVEQVLDISEQGLKNSLQPIPLETLEASTEHILHQEDITILETQKTETLVNLSSSIDGHVASGDFPTSIGASELEGPTIHLTFDGRAAEISSVTEGAETGTEVQIPVTEGDGDVEDGEIEPDSPEDTNTDSLPQQVFTDLQEEVDKNGINLSPDVLEADIQRLDESQGDEKPDISSGEVFQKSKEFGGLEGTGVQHKGEGTEASISENSSVRIGTRQAARNTTIHLAERAKERALIRRSGMQPPSPGKRMLRSVKKLSGVQRGRTTPDVQLQGTGDDESQPSQTTAAGGRHTGSQSAPPVNKLDAQRDEQE